MIDEKTAELRDYIINNDIATEEEVELVAQIDGWNIDTMNSILFARTGYADMEQAEEL